MMQMKGEPIHNGLNPEAETRFRCVKMTLVGIHSTFLVLMCIAAVIFIATSSSDRNNRKVDVDAILIGIVRENKTIVFVYLVLGVIGIVFNLFIQPMSTNILSIIVVSLTAYFAYMIVKKDRQVV
ncbi:unnamed protein product [Oppiella nova]|uniref:Uncharacterized protein n=1 Tax=Oppiella nova TaxID=334625 RepID=A0A7R9M7K2_9ACAR|nr:unnamed protein product [Oppiella nova]CAG2172269.1 unnamed protein product [Oppiella nova]